MSSEQGEQVIAALWDTPTRRGTGVRRLFNRRRLPAALPVVLLTSVGALALCFSLAHALGLVASPWVMTTIFLAAGTSSIAGFAFSAISGAMLFHLLNRPVHVVEIMLVCSISIQLLSVVALKNAIDLRLLSRFLLGGVLGLPLGVYLLTHISHSLYLHCMGVFLLVYGAYMLVRRPFVCPYAGRLGDCAAGFLGGITGGFAAFPGAFVTIWCGLKGWSKDKQRGVYQPYILIMQLLALVTIFLMQTANAQASGVDAQTLSYVPAALLGTWCGLAVFRRLTDVQFARWVNVLLIVSGIGLLT